MGYPIQQNQTAQPLEFLMVDSADHVTPKTGLSPTVTISKNGGSFASPSGAVSEIGNGWYKVAGNATDSNTLGPLLLHATGSGADPSDDRYDVVSYNPQDSVRLGLTALPNAAAGASGSFFLNTDTLAELSSGAPAATPTIAQCLMLLYMALRNKLTQTSTELKIHNDAGTAIAKSATSDDGTTFTRDEFGAP